MTQYSDTAQTSTSSPPETLRFRWTGCIMPLLIDVAVWTGLFICGMQPAEAQTISMPAALLACLLIPVARNFAGIKRNLPLSDHIYMIVLVIVLTCIRGGLFALLTGYFQLHPLATLALLSPTGIFTAVWALKHWALLSCLRTEAPGLWWPRIATGGAALFFLLRLALLGQPELIPEEAYYWLYAKHLSPGYLDHPPMVAWLIAAGTALFGHNEFAVRIGALLCSVAGGWFVWRLTEEMFDRSTAAVALLLYSALPFFFGAGLTTAPDAPLVASWCAALYYLRRATVGEDGKAWLAVGVAIGFGLLSKYTIVLAGGSAVFMAAFHPPSRKWLVRPHLYLGILVAALLFSPVIYWNATNDWASFAFQSSRRMNMPAHFGTHAYLLDIAVLITPAGLLFLLWWLWRTVKRDTGTTGSSLHAGDRLFVTLGILVPFLVFLLYSITHKTKLNWSGPAYIALLPLLSAHMVATTGSVRSRISDGILRTWLPTLAVLALVYSLGLLYVGIGIPGTEYGSTMRRFLGWKDLTSQVISIADKVEHETGERPMIISLDMHNIASELLFYSDLERDRQGNPREQITSRNILGGHALMFNYWDKGLVPTRNTFMLLARTKNDLRDEAVGRFFQEVGPTAAIRTKCNNRSVATYFYRLAQGFKPESVERIE